MKRIITFCLALIFVPGSAVAGDFMVEVRGQYFSPTEQAFKDIYGPGMMFGGKVSVSVWKGLAVWAGADYFSKKGELTFTKEETELEIIPLGIGLQYSHPFSNALHIYGGGGLQYYSYSEKNPIGDVSENGFGFLAEAGSVIMIAGNLFLDIFITYSSCNIEPADFRINIGGFCAGVGLGIRF